MVCLAKRRSNILKTKRTYTSLDYNMNPKSLKKIYCDDLFDILDNMEKCLGLFILRPDLELLFSFISGIKWTSFNENIKIKNIDKLDELYKFLLKKKKLKLENSMGWFGIIASEHGTGKDGYHKFFEYLNEFRKKHK